MCLKYKLKYIILFIILFITIGTFISIIFKKYDIGAFVALIIGILAFVGTIYSVDRNFKAIKLSSLPENSVNLLIDIEFLFNKYPINENNNYFKLFIEITSYWKEHQKTFRLLTPKFYKKFLKIISDENNAPEDTCPKKNSKYILKAILTQITNIKLEEKNFYFSFIEPQLITDDKNIKELGEVKNNYIEFKINKNNFEDYIMNISGEKTKKLTNEKFGKLNHEILNLLKGLKKEIEEYD